MDIIIKSVDFKASDRLEQFIEERISKLNNIADHIISAEVTLKAEKVQLIENKFVKIKLDMRGSQLFAEKHAKTFEEATDHVSEALRRQIKKYKEKIKK